MQVEVRAVFGRFLWRRIKIYDAIHSSFPRFENQYHTEGVRTQPGSTRFTLQHTNIQKSHICFLDREMSCVVTVRAGVENAMLHIVCKIFVRRNSTTPTNRSHIPPLCVSHGNHKLHSVCKALTHLRFCFSYLKQSAFSLLLFVQLWKFFFRNSLSSYLSFFCCFGLQVTNDVAQTCWSCLLSHFGRLSLSSHFDTIAIMSFIMPEGMFEWITISLRRYRLER